MNETLSLAVSQLEAALPDSGSFGAGGFLTTIQQFIAAVKAGQVFEAFSLETDLQVMIRDAMRGGDVINFGAASLLPGMSWLKLLQLIFTVMSELNK